MMKAPIVMITLLFTLLLLPASIILATTTNKCSIDDWVYFGMGLKYLRPNRSPKTHKEAMIACQKMGGQLATIRNAHEQSFIKGMNLGIDLYWIGLQRGNDDDKQYYWVDKTILTETDYQNWAGGKEKRGDCVVVHMVHEGPWLSHYCGYEQYYLCESRVPCSSNPAMTVNDEQMLDNGVATIINQQDVDIRCFLRGFTGNGYTLRVTCTNKPSYSSTAKNMSITLSVHFDGDTYQVKCECHSTQVSGRMEGSVITINYQESPHIVSNIGRNRTSVIYRGETIKLKLVITAFPEAYEYNLSRDGIHVSASEYHLASTPVMKMFAGWLVTVTLFHLVPEQSGVYSLTISNGVEEYLQCLYNLTVARVGSDLLLGSVDNSYAWFTKGWLMYYLIFMSGPVVFVLCVLVVVTDTNIVYGPQCTTSYPDQDNSI